MLLYDVSDKHGSNFPDLYKQLCSDRGSTMRCVGLRSSELAMQIRAVLNGHLIRSMDSQDIICVVCPRIEIGDGADVDTANITS